MIKSDRWIERMAKEHGIIAPFEARRVHTGVISYGLSSYGYDMRIARVNIKPSTASRFRRSNLDLALMRVVHSRERTPAQWLRA